MTSTTKAPSLDDIKAGFVFQSLDPIVGEPTYKSLELCHNQCIRNATTVDTRLGDGNHGHAGLVEFPDVYLLRTGHHFNRPPYPGANPTYPLAAGLEQRERLLREHNLHLQQFLTCQNIEKILLSMLENAIDNTFLTGIHDPAHGFGARGIIDVFRYLFNTYGSIGPEEILANQQRLTQPVDPNQPIAILFKQIEDCQKFAAAGQVAITPQQILKAAETLILQTGKYVSAYRDWIALPAVDKTYQNFKARMTQEYQLQNTMMTTARDAGYQANAAFLDAATAPDNKSLASAAHEFAAATAADRVAFEQLTTANGDLTTQLANMAIQNQALQQQMSQIQHHMMFMAQAQPPPRQQNPSRSGRRRNNRANRNQRPAGPAPAPPAYPPVPPQYPP